MRPGRDLLITSAGRRPDGVGATALVVVLALGAVSVAVYLLRRAWLGPWLGGHLTNTVFVFVVVVLVSLGGLLLRAVRWVGYLLGLLALVAALGLETLQGFTPGQAFDPTDSALSVAATAIGLAVTRWLDLRHLPWRAPATSLAHQTRRPDGDPVVDHDQQPRESAKRTVIGLCVLGLGVLMLAFAAVMLASGNDSGRTRWSGLVLGIVLTGYGIVEIVRWQVAARREWSR